MKKLILKSMMLLSVLALTFTSCSDNDDKVVTTPVSLSIEMPLGLENIVLSNAKAVFTNVTTNETFIQEQFQEKMVALWHLLPMCLKEHTMLPSAVT
jgi:hypothetical protein